MPDIMRTLIVDDKERNRLVLEKILSDYGTCESSRDGREAIEAFQAAWEGGTRQAVCKPEASSYLAQARPPLPAASQ